MNKNNKFPDSLIGVVTSGQKWRKKKCEKCGKIFNRLIKDKDGLNVCGHCKNKNKKVCGGYGFKVSLEKALSKVYTFHAYFNKKTGRDTVICSFPPVLARRKFKIVLVDENEIQDNPLSQRRDTTGEDFKLS